MGENLGLRVEYTKTFTAAAVDIDLKPNVEFELGSVNVICASAPSTSEKLTIRSYTTTENTIEELQPTGEDLSIDGVAYTKKCFIYRFDKKFPLGTTIKIDYANTAAHAGVITVVITYIEERGTAGTRIDDQD